MEEDNWIYDKKLGKIRMMNSEEIKAGELREKLQNSPREVPEVKEEQEVQTPDPEKSKYSILAVFKEMLIVAKDLTISISKGLFKLFSQASQNYYKNMEEDKRKLAEIKEKAKIEAEKKEEGKKK